MDLPFNNSDFLEARGWVHEKRWNWIEGRDVPIYYRDYGDEWVVQVVDPDGTDREVRLYLREFSMYRIENDRPLQEQLELIGTKLPHLKAKHRKIH